MYWRDGQTDARAQRRRIQEAKTDYQKQKRQRETGRENQRGRETETIRNRDRETESQIISQAERNKEG